MKHSGILIAIICLSPVLHLAAQNTPTIVSNTPVVVAPTVAHTNNPGEIRLLSGQVYRHCQVTREEPDGITVMHAKGIAKLFFVNLPDEYRSKYDYDPKKAAAYTQAVAMHRSQITAKKNEDKQLQEDEENQDRAEKESNSARAKAKVAACNALTQKIQSRTATTANCRVLVGCSKDEVAAIMGRLPDSTIVSGSTWIYDNLIDPESLKFNSIQINFKADRATRVYW